MKAKNSKTSVEKEKPRDTFVNVLTFVLFGVIFLVCGIAVYFNEVHRAEKTDKYISNLPSFEHSISPDKVCMHDNLYSASPRIPVHFMNRTYYGCNKKAIGYLSSDESLRFAIDPVDKTRVDKATAIIALHPDRNGKVMYFGSKQTYNKYLMTLKKAKEK